MSRVKMVKRLLGLWGVILTSWHRNRIKLRSYWVPLIEDSCKQIMDATRTTNAKTMDPVPLPTKKRIYCVFEIPSCSQRREIPF